jgi:hypothetical protein
MMADESPQAYLHRLDRLVNEMAAVGIKTDDAEQAHRLLRGLPTAYSCIYDNVAGCAGQGQPRHCGARPSFIRATGSCTDRARGSSAGGRRASWGCLPTGTAGTQVQRDVFCMRRQRPQGARLQATAEATRRATASNGERKRSVPWRQLQERRVNKSKRQ